MIRRLIFVLATLLLLSSPALALYNNGTLTGGLSTTFTLTNPAGNGPAAATICFLLPATKHAPGSVSCLPLTATPTVSTPGVASATVTLSTGATRVIVEVDVTANATVPLTLQVSQTVTSFQDMVTTDTRFVFDVVL